MRVERFSLFFPPLLLKRKRGETEYGIGAIPLGGFVKITGMNPEEELPPDVAPRAYYHQPVWKRIVVIGAGPAMNLLIAFVILFVLAFGDQRGDEPGRRRSRTGSPADGKLETGDRITRRRRQADTASAEDRFDAFATRSASTSAPATPTRRLPRRRPRPSSRSSATASRSS